MRLVHDSFTYNSQLNLQLKSADVFCKALKETANFNYVMTKEKSKSSTSVLAADEKFLNSCANRTAEIFKKQLATICEEIKQDFKSIFEAEIAVLKTEISELKKSQTFISTQYDEILEINRNQSDELKILMNSYEDLKFNHNKLKAINEKQNEDMKILREKADVLDKKTNDEAVKLDGIDQYSRRQNLEFQGIPLTENEDAIELVTKISNLVGVDVKKSDISTAHRLPPKRHAKVADPAPTTSHLNVVVQSPSLHWGGSKWLVNSPRVSSSGDSPLDNSSHFLSRLSNARSHVDSTLKPN